MKKFYFFLVAMVLGVVSANAIDYYLIGGFNGWKAADPACKFTAAGADEYVLDYKGDLTSGFKINDGTWANDAANFGGTGSALYLGEPFALSAGGSSADINLAEGAVANPHIVLNTAAMTLTITGEEAEVVITYDIWGNLPDGGATWAATPLVNTDGTDKWVAKNVAVTDASNFGIRELTNGAQSGWISADGDAAVVGAGSFACKLNGTNFSIAPGNYDFSYDAAAMTLTVALSSAAVEGIEVEENVAPVYYNLQGVRVDAPANGLYIVVRGDKVAKEIVK